MDVYLWLLTICACFVFTQAQNCKRDQRCRISKVHGMKSADCFKRDMTEFPQCITSDVEIIELTSNRIRKLTRNDLKKYSDLKMLYLSDNLIVSIHEEVFEGKVDLHTLDLSLNAISKLPPVVFHLPSLKSLYLGQNLNMNIVNVVEKAKPVTSPLVQLDLSYVMQDDPNELPEFGVLPFLTKYNISGNKLINTTTKQFAGICNLKILDSSNVSIEFVEACDCWTLNRWLHSRKVQFTPFKCNIKETECFDTVPDEDVKIYEQCLSEKEAIVQKSRLMKILIPIAVVAFIIIVVIVYCVIRRRRQKQNQRKTDPADQKMLYENGLLSKS